MSGPRTFTKPKKPPKFNKKLKAFASSVGDFIRYWGFRRIHGQIWTQIYLSKSPLSGADLTRSLRVSKALVSPAISELLKHKLIVATGGDKKTKLYSANPDVFNVVREVIVNREKKLLGNSLKCFLELSEGAEAPDSELNPDRLKEVGSMIAMANMGIEILLNKVSYNSLTPSA